MDEFYDATIIRFNAWCGWLANELDYWVWNGSVLAVSYVVLGLSWVNRFFDEYVVNLGFDQGCREIRRGGGLLSHLQNGQVQNYLRVIGVALAALFLFLMWGCQASAEQISPIITVLTFMPLIGAILLAGFNGMSKQLARKVALAFGLASLGLAVMLWTCFDSASSELMQFREHHDWIPTLGAEYVVGIDGLGLLMVLLTAIVTPLAMLASWKIDEKVPLYFSMVLFLETGLFGTFTALNFFHWFIYWELGLVPAFFLIKLWGGPSRSAAATQFFIYTMVGSVAMLLSFLAIYWTVQTFDFMELSKNGCLERTGWRVKRQIEEARTI